MADLAPTASNLNPETDSFGTGEAGEACSAGDILFKDSDGSWYLTDANDNTKPASNEQMAMVLNDAIAGQPVLLYSAINKYVDMGAILTVGEVYVTSETAGKIAPKSDLSSSTNEVQDVTVSGATTGTFTLTFDGQTTNAIAFNATAATVQTELEALSNIGSGNVSCTGGPLNTSAVSCEFQNDLGSQDVAEMTVTNSTDGTVSVSTTTAGVTGAYFNYVGYAKTTSQLVLKLDRTGVQL